MLQQLKGHAAAVNQVAWINSCGPVCLLSAGDDGVLLLWSLATTGRKFSVTTFFGCCMTYLFAMH